MKRFSLFVVVAMLTTSLYAAAQVEHVDANKLPKASHEFIHKYFSQTEISRVEMDKHPHGDNYVVYFVNGDKAMFDASSGKCTGLDLATGSVPDALIPEKVRSYVTSHYPSSHVVAISHIAGGSRLVLSNGTSLCFDRDGNPMKKDAMAKQCDACKECASGKPCSKHMNSAKH